MQKFNIYEAKTNFSKLITLVEHNQEVVIARNGRFIAKLVPFTEDNSSKMRIFGTMRGQIKVSKDFDAPLPDDLLDSFYSDTI